ncbi:MAG: hypothetical protein A2092_13465 [Rhodobacteraceae bacterium GWE1_64_9]|nr:MAG: hypothetical protein A2092_13465 [Rhodobacteraceae bacterium GWE1_64_9]HBU15721.1 hypothetical protein [Gemmobacter sp.]
MTYAVWPTSLPRPERNSWQRQPQDSRLKRQTDAGPPGWRRRFSSAAQMVSLSVMLTRNQKAIFDRFFGDITRGGSLLFWMPDPTTDGWPMLDNAGNPLLSGGVPLLLSARWLVSFGDQLPQESIQGTEFRKAFSVVVMP